MLTEITQVGPKWLCPSPATLTSRAVSPFLETPDPRPTLDTRPVPGPTHQGIPGAQRYSAAEGASLGGRTEREAEAGRRVSSLVSGGGG